jgi:hypothetical protein
MARRLSASERRALALEGFGTFNRQLRELERGAELSDIKIRTSTGSVLSDGNGNGDDENDEGPTVTAGFVVLFGLKEDISDSL